MIAPAEAPAALLSRAYEPPRKSATSAELIAAGAARVPAPAGADSMPPRGCIARSPSPMAMGGAGAARVERRLEKLARAAAGPAKVSDTGA